MHTTQAAAKLKPEKKNQAWTGFEPMKYAIPVQFSTKIISSIDKQK